MAQCDSVYVNNDMTVSSTTTMSGTYNVNGTFTIPAGVTVYVIPHSTNGCGSLKIYADNIVIEGTIDGNYAGYPGGSGGMKGNDVSSVSGHAVSLTSCFDEGTQGQVVVAGGFGGDDGEGPGGGSGGNDGDDGEGTKQYCGNFGDEAGVVGGAGGAGGGAGGSYGGQGSSGSTGGNGAAGYSPNGLDVEDSYTVSAGTGGAGGTVTGTYGTLDDRDIDMGSGGAGAGGGGRSHYLGSDGGNGGAGGGMVFLKATASLNMSGTITVNGEQGTYGGNGGSGDATDDCCSDGCNGCDERTLSCGSGSGAGSGGGSGGGVFIESEGTANISGTITANGGNNGLPGQKGNGAACDYDGGIICGSHDISTDDGFVGGDGGSGGGGRIKIFVADCAQANITASTEVFGGAGASDGTFAEVCGYLSVDELSDLNWNVYPVPFSSEVTVTTAEYISGSVLVLDAAGQMVYQTNFNGNSVQLPLTNLQAGIYFVQLSGAQGTFTRKIIKK